MTTHGLSNNPVYKTWYNMMNSCYNKYSRGYYYSGVYGAYVCEEWHEPKNFIKDMEPTYESGLWLSRVHINRNNLCYCPEFCSWVTLKQHKRNTTNSRMLTYNNKTLCLSEWAEQTGVCKQTLSKRLELGWSVEKTLNTI